MVAVGNGPLRHVLASEHQRCIVLATWIGPYDDSCPSANFHIHLVNPDGNLRTVTTRGEVVGSHSVSDVAVELDRTAPSRSRTPYRVVEPVLVLVGSGPVVLARTG